MISKPLTLLHLSDTQFGRNHRFAGTTLPSQNDFDNLLIRLTDDLQRLQQDYQLRLDLIVVSGDLAEWGMKSEFDQLEKCLLGLCEFTQLSRERVVLVPGNHDINRNACYAYFLDCAADEKQPQAPFWPKWRHYERFFKRFYKNIPEITFTQKQPWTFYQYPDLKLVVAGLNSTIHESHRDEDHYGWVGEHQLRWFADQLKTYKDQQWFRLAVVHHNLRRGPVADDENLRDAEDLHRYLANNDAINLLLHGHTHDGKRDWLQPNIPILATGSAALDEKTRPNEIPNQYQLIQLWPDRYKRWTREYNPARKDWMGDNRASDKGDDWRDEQQVDFADVAASFSN